MTTFAQKGKESAAISGVWTSGILSTIELGGGILTVSLGLIASALNTILDFMATIIAFIAVRKAGEPPDEEHLYGHGKIESLAALAEIALLFIVCAWIVLQAFNRLSSGFGEVERWPMALGINFVSILLDAYAYRRCRSAAQEYGSEALGAGALHFVTDGLIALVVIAGLVLYRFGYWYADSLAAIIVVGFILISSVRMMKDAAGVLLDRAPKGVVRELKREVVTVEGVMGCHNIRVRRSGSRVFVDMHIDIDRSVSLQRAHSIASLVEEKVERLFPGSDVVIHTEPKPMGEEDLISRVRDIAAHFPEIKDLHGIRISGINKSLFIEYHIELEREITLNEAHNIAVNLERRLRSSFDTVEEIISHIEPHEEHHLFRREAVAEAAGLRNRIVKIIEGIPDIRSCHKIRISTENEKYYVTMHCIIDGSIPLDFAHDLATKVEEQIKTSIEKIERVTVHCEPSE